MGRDGVLEKGQWEDTYGKQGYIGTDLSGPVFVCVGVCVYVCYQRVAH